MNYKIEPATPDDIRWIAKFETEMYSPVDAVPGGILKNWYAQNPNGFSIIKHDDETIGHVDLLPLKSNIVERFIGGSITEQEIRSDDLFSAQEWELVRTVYVESLAIAASPDSRRAAAVKHLLLNMIDVVRRIGDPQRIEYVYAVAATDNGSRFLKRLGFGIVSHAQDRKDQHNLYATRLASLEDEINKRALAPVEITTTAAQAGI
jgi:N-acetylglutamate synthase-like GNAT family acetyltransferase